MFTLWTAYLLILDGTIVIMLTTPGDPLPILMWPIPLCYPLFPNVATAEPGPQQSLLLLFIVRLATPTPPFLTIVVVTSRTL